VKLPVPRLGDKGPRVLFELVSYVPVASGASDSTTPAEEAGTAG
jgi:hypothetical protein